VSVTKADPIHAVPRARSRSMDYRRIVPGLLAEVVFATLPLLVVAVVLKEFQKSPYALRSPEWSFAAAILFGQSIVRFMSGFAHGGHARPGPVSLAVTLIIVFGLTPSLLVLSAILTSEFGGQAAREPALWMVVAQIVLFVLAAVTFMVFGAIGEAWRLQEEMG
jgi:hypothetical protein